MTNLENLGLEIYASGIAGVSFRKHMLKLYFVLFGQVSDWIMSTPDNDIVYNFDMWDADNLK